MRMVDFHERNNITFPVHLKDMYCPWYFKGDNYSIHCHMLYSLSLNLVLPKKKKPEVLPPHAQFANCTVSPRHGNVWGKTDKFNDH